MVKLILKKLLDAIYPHTCHRCGIRLEAGWSLCPPCRESFLEVSAPMCNKCGECFDGAISDEFTCPNCHQLKLVFHFARAAYQGTEDTLDLIHQFKYQSQIHLSKELGLLTSKALSDPRFDDYLKNGTLIPVPLHWRRYRKRTFNQSDEISKAISSIHAGLTTVNALKRIRYTQTQTSFSRAKRLTNLKGAFKVRNKFIQQIKGRRIILIDDVFTTGSTANECSKALIKAGASSVAILTFLRG